MHREEGEGPSVQQQQQDSPKIFTRSKVNREPVKSTRLVKVPILARRPRTRSARRSVVEEEEEEEYLEIKEEEAVRRKEIWVKKLVEERYTKKTPVRSVRKVRRRKVQYENTDDFDEVPAYRVDEIDEVQELETKTVHPYEVVEQDMPMMRTLPPQEVESKLHEPEPGSLSARRIGRKAYLEGQEGGRRSRRIRGQPIEMIPLDTNHTGPTEILDLSE